jgi:hypothetical protein
MPLSREVVIDGIVLSYQMTNAASHIDLWRLVALGVPGQVAALFSDATILASLVPTQYQKQVGAIRPPNGLTLALRLKFQSPTHEIRIGTIALQLDPRRTLVDLATVGDAITLPAAQATLQQALLGVQSVGGGIVALTPGTAPDLTVRESKTAPQYWTCAVVPSAFNSPSRQSRSLLLAVIRKAGSSSDTARRPPSGSCMAHITPRRFFNAPSMARAPFERGSLVPRAWGPMPSSILRASRTSSWDSLSTSTTTVQKLTW